MKRVVFFLALFILISLSFNIAWDASAENEASDVLTTTSEDGAIELEYVEQDSDEINFSVGEIDASDFGIKEPAIPPGHWAYGFKRAWQNLRIAFIFDPTAKAKLQARYLNQDLIGIRKRFEVTSNAEKQSQLLKIYQDRSEKLEKIVEEIKTDLPDSEELDAIIGWLAENQLKHVVVLDGLIQKLPSHAAEKIEAIKESQMERIIDKIEIMEETGRIDEILERLNKVKANNSQQMEKIKNEIQVRSQIIQQLNPAERQELGNVLRENVRLRLQPDYDAPTPSPTSSQTQSQTQNQTQNSSGDNTKDQNSPQAQTQLQQGEPALQQQSPIQNRLQLNQE